MDPISFTFKSKDGLSLLGRAWVSSTSQPKGIIHLIHGLGEHSGRYDHIGNALGKAGYHLVALDLRGHGLSAGMRGHSPGLTNLRNDIQVFVEESAKYLGNALPKFLYGHDFGGNLVINFVLKHRPQIKGCIVTSPALELAKSPPKVKAVLEKFFGIFASSIKLNNGLNRDALSRNPAIVKAHQDDVYTQHTLSARLGLDLLESGKMALHGAEHWDSPLLLMHGTGDRISSYQATQVFSDNAGDLVELVLWEDYYHELHNDFASQKVVDKIISWLDMNVKECKEPFLDRLSRLE